jgi:hypothetical protein
MSFSRFIKLLKNENKKCEVDFNYIFSSMKHETKVKSEI